MLPFDRRIFNTRERPLIEDVNGLQSLLDYTHRETLRALANTPVGFVGPTNWSELAVSSTRFVHDGFMLRAKNPASLSVIVTKGLGFFYDASDAPADIAGIDGLADISAWKPLVLNKDEEIVVPTPDALLPRIDILEIKVDRFTTENLTRRIFDVATKTWVNGTVDKVLRFAVDTRITVNGAGALNYKTGTPGVTPAVPATTPGYERIAVVTVPAAAAAINDQNIGDLRPMFEQGHGRALSLTWDAPTTGALPQAPSIVQILAPPGVRAAVTMTAPASGGEAVVRILAGRVSQMSVTLACGFAPSGELYIPELINPQINDMSAADDAALADATITHPLVRRSANNGAPFSALSGPDIVPFVQFGVRAKHQAGGTTNFTIPGPLRFTAHVLFR